MANITLKQARTRLRALLPVCVNVTYGAHVVRARIVSIKRYRCGLFRCYPLGGAQTLDNLTEAQMRFDDGTPSA